MKTKDEIELFMYENWVMNKFHNNKQDKQQLIFLLVATTIAVLFSALLLSNCLS